ncbi:PaaD-like zinc ribbon domain-containing protein [Effusibacillus pohliae]
MLIDRPPCCPFCNSSEVSLHSPFGTAQLVRQYYCHSCRSVFEYVRWQNTVEEIGFDSD